jgi:hypothetical protein
MSNDLITTEELTRERTPSQLLTWVESKREQIASTDEGERALILHQGLAKQFEEEVCPLAIFGQHKFGNTHQVLLQPVIGKAYDAVVTDLRSKPVSQSYIEITQSHEGENDYLRRLLLSQQGFVFHGPVIKTGTKKTGLHVSIPPEAFVPSEVAEEELKRILEAARRKEGKDYPSNTSLIIFFQDDLNFRKAIDDRHLGIFVKENILTLDLRFEVLYLVGQYRKFGEFSLSTRS